MKKIKVSEIFYSIQGEGRHMGAPSVFLRTFGCNLKCEGFGMPAGEKSQERIEIALDEKFKMNAKTIHDLPLVSTGCDSYASWDTAFKHLSPSMQTEQLANDMCDLLPGGKWDPNVHLVVTGGEPLLGWQRAYVELLEHPSLHNLVELTFETNGTQKLHDDFRVYLENHRHSRELKHHALGSRRVLNVTFSISPKLSASGELPEDAIKPEIVALYDELGEAYVKYVCNTEEHVLEAINVTEQYREAGFTGDVYIMPTGGMAEMYNSNRRDIAELCMKYKLKYSPRLHVDIWGNAWAT